jgi:hypothetical protein
LKPVRLSPKTHALLLFDFMGANCGARPRCVEATPTLKTPEPAPPAARRLHLAGRHDHQSEHCAA